MKEAFKKSSNTPRDYERDRGGMALDSSKREWTITHSFFAASGGFAFDTSDLPEDQQFLPGSRERVTLTSEGLVFVAENAPWLIPNVSAESINDKSKANGLAKAIVCFQAAWFLAETIARLAQSLPISLLELNTFAHALCALLIYILWWNKPLDVEEPFLIRGKSMRRICADLCYSSKFTSAREGPNAESRFNLRREYQSVSRPITVKKGLKDRISNIPKNLDFLNFGNLYYKTTPTAYLEDTIFFFAFAIAGLAYGGLHLIAWNYPFLFPTQQFLWKLSGLTVAASGVVLIPVGVLFAFAYDCADQRGHADISMAIMLTCYVLFCIPFAGFYLFARGYLVVACFLTFPYLPAAVFQQPEWSYYFPHIS
jgi:hypothetical protein